MSKSTLRKRIALTATTALFAGMLSFIAAPSALAAGHPAAGENNGNSATGTPNGSLFVATTSNTTGAAAVATAAAGTSALSLGLLAKDSTSGTAQTATLLAGGKLSLYATVSTAAAFTATAGTFASTSSTNVTTYAYGSDLKSTLIASAAATTMVGTVWTAPSTAGTYTVSLLTGFILNSSGAYVVPSYTAGLPSTLSGNITVTVVASSAGSTYSAIYSACNTATTSSATITGIDSTSSVDNDGSWFIDFALKDAYNASLPSGNIIATATNGGLVSIGTAGTAPLAGTAATVVSYATGSSANIRIVQPTSGVPLTTTVTISYNGTTVCTKTVTIRGTVDSLVVSGISTQKLSTATHTTDLDGTGRTTGQLFYVQAKDSAGNLVPTSTIGTFSYNAASLAGQTIVTSLSIASSATSNSSTNLGSYSTGLYGCGATAGEVKTAKLDFTITATGKIITSPAFTLRCAGDPYTYTASWDKASYVQGELATLTVKFLDSKGNAANNVTSPGAAVIAAPMMSAVTTTGSATVLPKADGSKAYTWSVGTNSGMTAGSYVSVVDFTGLTAVAAEKQTPAYKLSTGADSTTNADVLKSIVALIASINKQIQALQKLILKK